MNSYTKSEICIHCDVDWSLRRLGISIENMLGQTVYEDKTVQTAMQHLDISKLSAGQYLINVVCVDGNTKHSILTKK